MIRRLSYFILLSPTFLLCSCITDKALVPDSVSWLPRELDDGWKPSGTVALYTPETIFEYIDGEAEMYFPYGFEKAITRTYKKENNLIVADIYVMGSLLDAFGIFSNYRTPTTSPFEVGAEGFADDYQIMFYKGDCFVRITAVGNPEKSKQALQQCALRISDALSSGKDKPVELSLFESEGIVPTSIRYIAKSVIGYPFFKRGFVADYDNDGIKARLFVVPEATEEDARAVLKQYSDFIKKSGGTAELQETILVGTDPLYKKVVVRNYGNVVVGLTNISSDEPPIELLDEVGKRASTVFAPASS